MTENYGYDAIYQLTGVTQGASTTESYTYDPVGNRLSSLGVALYSYNNSNQLLLTSTPTTMTYDDNGNTVTKVDAIGTATYAWDFENRLISVTLPAGGGTVSFKYDPFGRRIQKASASGTANYAYDGANMAEEVDAAGSVLARYSMGPGIDQPLAMLRGGVTSYYQADGLGSVTSLTDGTGSAAATYVYDSFGNLVTSSGSLVNPFRYTGRELDPETGLYYYRARYYSTNFGRFISPDPIGFAGGLNEYVYSEDSPQNFVDPLGLCIVDAYFAPVYRLGLFLGYHAFLVVTDNSMTTKLGAVIFRGGPDENGLLFVSIADAFHAEDKLQEANYTANLLTNKCSCLDIRNRLARTMNKINDSKFPYRWNSANSNAAIRTAIDDLGLSTPTIPWYIFPKPGWGKDLYGH